MSMVALVIGMTLRRVQQDDGESGWSGDVVVGVGETHHDGMGASDDYASVRMLVGADAWHWVEGVYRSSSFLHWIGINLSIELDHTQGHIPVSIAILSCLQYSEHSICLLWFWYAPCLGCSLVIQALIILV